MRKKIPILSMLIASAITLNVSSVEVYARNIGNNTDEGFVIPKDTVHTDEDNEVEFTVDISPIEISVSGNESSPEIPVDTIPIIPNEKISFYAEINDSETNIEVIPQETNISIESITYETSNSTIEAVGTEQIEKSSINGFVEEAEKSTVYGTAEQFEKSEIIVESVSTYVEAQPGKDDDEETEEETIEQAPSDTTMITYYLPGESIYNISNTSTETTSSISGTVPTEAVQLYYVEDILASDNVSDNNPEEITEIIKTGVETANTNNPKSLFATLLGIGALCCSIFTIKKKDF